MRNFVKLVTPFIPAFISVCGGLLLVIGLILYVPLDNKSQLLTTVQIIVVISILLVVVILGFILTKTSQLQFTGDSTTLEIQKLTQQVHYFRDIADILVRSKVWAPGLKEYIDEEFTNLNYFLVKEFYKGRSKLALEYIEEKDRYGETEILYLETKAILLNDPNKGRVDNYMNPKEYDSRMLKKWAEHKVGTGWNHYFGFKYNQFKEELDVSRIYERHQEKIINYAVQIDTIRYQDVGFSEELISKLGMHLSDEVIPQLLALTLQAVKRVPKIMTIAFTLVVLLIIFGVFQPIAIILFNLEEVFSFISISVVLSVLMFLMLSIYPFITSQINK